MDPTKTILSEQRTQSGLNNYVRLNHLISCLGMRTLRLLFRDRYKTGTDMDWENGSMTLNKDFINRARAIPDLTMEQKKALESADINNLDFTFLVIILQSMDHRTTKFVQLKQKQNTEDKALKLLPHIRNKVESMADEGIPNGGFRLQWQLAKNTLLLLGAREEDIEYFRTTSKLASLDSNREAPLNQQNETKSKALMNRANELITAGELEGGIQLCTEALQLVGLSITAKSCLHWVRSEAYINQLEDHMEALSDAVVQKCMEIAKEDSSLVIQLQPKWWKGHFLEGKCFQLQKLYIEAIDSFEKALSLNPGSQEVINARDVCRLHIADDEQVDFDAFSTPNSSPSPETVENREADRLLIKMNELMLQLNDPVTRAAACLFLGHRYADGEGVPLDKEKATRFFRQAAEAGSPDGAYNAGISYLRGVGVKQNIPEAVKYYEAAAEYNVQAGVEHWKDLDAIASSKLALGNCYRSGYGKPRNYVKAAEWYAQAALERCGVAAVNLATMFSVGVGIPRDVKRALQYQKLAVDFGLCTGHVYCALAQYFLLTGDLTQVHYWYDRALTSGRTYPDSAYQHFENQIQVKQQGFEELKKKLPDHVLNSQVPIHILYERYLKRLRRPEWSDLMNLQRKAADFLSSNPDFGESLRVDRILKRAEMEKLAAQGQEYAKILLGAVEHLRLGLAAVTLLRNPEFFPDGFFSRSRREAHKLFALAEVSACFTAEVSYATNISGGNRLKVVEFAREFINDMVKSDSDLHARVCLLNLSMASLEEAVKFAKEWKELYPEEPHFHIMHVKVLGFLKKHEEGVQVAEESLKRFPDNAELLIHRAWFMCWNLMPTGDCECTSQIEAFKEFIKKAPSGHRNIPEAYYWIAHLYISAWDFEKFVTNYNLGIEAEKELLSNFLPYHSSCKESADDCSKLFYERNTRYSTRFQNLLEGLLEADPEENEEVRNLKLTNPKRIVAVKDCRNEFACWEAKRMEEQDLRLPLIPVRTAMEGQQTQRAPSRKSISSLKNICFADMDPTIDSVQEGRVINLTIMEEYIDWLTDCIHSVVKDDNDDFNLICFYNFDRSQPSTKKTLGFGSRIRLMNPYLVPRPGGPAVRVDDPSSVVLVSSGEGNPICRYCWKPNPRLSCSKCKTAQYCNKECQKLDWEVLGHKELCKVLCRRHRI